MKLERQRVGRRAGRRRRLAVLTTAIAVVGTTVFAVAAGAASSAAAAPRASQAARAPRAAAHGARHAGKRAVKPLRVVAISPRNGTKGVGATKPITIELSAPLSPRSAMPSIGPSVRGAWHDAGDRLTFTPSEPFVPLSQVTLTLPAGRDGLVGTRRQLLTRRVVDDFTIADGSTLRLQQLLSLLDYSPLSWRPSGRAIAAGDTGAQLAAMYRPPRGTFAWRDAGWPSSLVGLWQEGAYDVFTRGLVMSFQADHGLIVNGAPSGGLWNDLLTAVAAGEVNTGGYNYALGDKRTPQTLTVWHDGTVVLHAAANTGIPQSPTPSGTFPVYARYRNEIMRGKNPDGTPYADPVQYVAYFYDGDAVHYFPRADYGVPQSLGCIELSLAQAATAWPYLAYGTLVTVVN